MSAYIVTVKQTTTQPGMEPWTVFSRAAASLDGAQQFARTELYERVSREERTETSLGYEREAYWFTALRGEANDLPEEGGTIELPGGIVIEVAPITEHALGLAIGREDPWWDRKWIAEKVAAYNEAQGRAA